MVCGESQSNYWFGKLDDLWSFGKPTGWGGPWWETPLKAGAASSPYLMTGFDKKVLHLRSYSQAPVNVQVEIDFQGNQRWCPYQSLALGAQGYQYHVFPDGFSAHWVRLTVDADCVLSAYFHYT